MTDVSSPVNTPKDAALRQVGRTVVNFQRLEHNLKQAAQLAPLRGTLQKIQRDIAKQRERASALTLGQAIYAWLDYCSGYPGTHRETRDLFDVSLEVTTTLAFDPESHAGHAKALCDLLTVRNELIHSRLAKVDWDSPEACDILAAELERINESISEQIEYTGALIGSGLELREEGAKALAAQFESAAPTGAELMPSALFEQTRKG